MPGSGRCARCGAMLALATAAIDVHPPRATGWSRKLPWFTNWQWNINRIRALVWSIICSPFGPREAIVDRPPSVLALLLPGRAQIQRGEKARGWTFLVLYLGLLAMGALLLGTSRGSILLGLAFTTHVTSAVDAVAANYSSFGDRFRLTLCVGVLLASLVYWPASWAILRVATPLQITGEMPPFQRGDVVWYNRSAAASVGSLVVYEVPELSVAGRMNGQAAMFNIEGMRINRVAAVAGQQVQWNGSQLLVDGTPAAWQPATPPPDRVANFAIPEGHALILPDNLWPREAQLGRDSWKHVAVVPVAQIEGIVYFRNLPWRRLGVVD